ncbi:MAG: hypothetical protein M3R50_01475 [Bacteroidota bacterium]|nr:hypothetical protein [Bacteroidota bacterium]
MNAKLLTAFGYLQITIEVSSTITVISSQKIEDRCYQQPGIIGLFKIGVNFK